MKVQSELDLLNEAVRKKLIEDCFDCDANQRRKADAFKAYECLKDKTSNYVLELLLKQFELPTVVEMQYAISNISILRKVIEKLAKVYSNGVKRTMESEQDTQAVEKLAEALKLNEKMSKANRYYRTFKNTLVQVKPVKDGDKFCLKVDVLPPFKYDAVENPDNPELPLAIITSDYAPKRPALYAIGDAATAGRFSGNVREITAPMPAQGGSALAGEKDAREFVWWTKNFHFTTDAKGVVISGPDVVNPITDLPFVNIAGDQDGEFFAEGGSDLVDAGIKINTMVTNVRHVGVSQGYGQLFMTGKNLPKSVKVGPNHCVQLEHENDDPVPVVGYLNSNPPLDSLRALVEMDVALMLTTNNLSTSGFSMDLKSGKDFASGIALMIDKSESVEDVKEQSLIFVEREPKVWGLVGKWADVYGSRDLLTEEFAALEYPAELEKVQLSFPSPKPLTSEKEELEVIEKRRELGLNTEIELLMRDNPSMTEDEARAKLKLIEDEKKARMEAAVEAAGAMGDGNQEGNGKPGEDDDDDRPHFGSGLAGAGKDARQE